MCGIVGYVGYRDCSEVLIESLKKLEYRGYDSAGIAVFENGEIKVAKSKGRLVDLEKKMEITGKPMGKSGVGHTRWATHGEPSDINSHPHNGGKVTIVHNGIIENYQSLKEMLLKQGRSFLSQTDTEVVAQLLDYYYNGDPIATIATTMRELQGSFALGIVFKDFPDRVYAVRKESPLIVGIGKDESFIASDVSAILRYTKDYYLLEHNEIAILTHEYTKIVDLHGNELEKTLKTADWDIEAAEKCGYEHFMIKEIFEQPTAVKTTITPRIKNNMPYLDECGISDNMLKDIQQITVVACGTAMHAGMVGKYVIESIARVPVVVDIASEFRYRSPIIDSKDLVVIISQSGETADSIAALRLAKSLGAKTLGIVNAKGSTIARESDMLIYTHAGPEIAVASTKAYMVQLSVLYLLAFRLAFVKGAISSENCADYTTKLMQIPSEIEKVLETKSLCQYVSTKLIAADSLLYIGRGLDYALSMEGSLKLKEISYIHSEAYGAGELKHGTISLISDGMPVIAVVTQSNITEKTISNIEEVKSRGAMVITICRESLMLQNCKTDHVIRIPDIDDLLIPMTAVVSLQLIAYYTAVLRGNDVDKPRNLAKSVTVE